MPNRDTPPLTRGVVLRGIGFALAIVLGGIAVWLIVTSTTQKRIEIGVLTGLWGLLLGAYSMFGSRRPLSYGDEVLDTAQPSSAVELRPGPTPLERAEAAAERRAFQAGLEQLLHREIRTAVSLEVGELRSEIAALRSELLEKVGGQIRLERIETTRVIGSDLEALQQEVRQLKTLREPAAPAPVVPSIVNLAVSGEPAITRLVPARAPLVDEPAAAIVEPLAPARPLEPEPAVESTAPIPQLREMLEMLGAAGAANPAALLVPAEAAAPPPAAETPAPPPAAEPESPAAAPPAAASPTPEDPFAGLPRIRPFTEFALDPIEPLAPVPAAEPPAATNGGAHPLQRLRHAAPEEPDGTVAAAQRGSGAGGARRHRRAEESNAGQELLAKLLAREGS